MFPNKIISVETKIRRKIWNFDEAECQTKNQE